MKKILNITGQSLLEYTLLIGVVLLIVFTMNPLIKRGTQGVIKTVADQIGDQVNGDQTPYDQTGMTYKELWGKGGLDTQVSSTKAQTNKRLVENAGDITYQFFDRTETHSNTDMSMGHTEQ